MESESRAPKSKPYTVQLEMGMLQKFTKKSKAGFIYIYISIFIYLYNLVENVRKTNEINDVKKKKPKEFSDNVQKVR